MRRDWDLDDLIAGWTLVEADRKLMANKYKYGPTLLGFCLMLKFFEIEGRFPAMPGRSRPPAVEFVAHQVKMEPGDLAGYDFKGRSIKEHRAQIREALGYRVFSRCDEDTMGLTPLFWSSVALHGTFTLDMDTRLDYARGAVAIPAPRPAPDTVPAGVE